MRFAVLLVLTLVGLGSASRFNGSPKLNQEKILTARAHERLNVQDLPDAWDW